MTACESDRKTIDPGEVIVVVAYVRPMLIESTEPCSRERPLIKSIRINLPYIRWNVSYVGDSRLPVFDDSPIPAVKS